MISLYDDIRDEEGVLIYNKTRWKMGILINIK